MHASFLAVRAIGTVLAQRVWVGVLVGAVVIGALLVALLLWLVSLSAWWWLLALPIGVLLSVAVAVLLIFRFLISYVRPEQTHSQKKQVAEFVHKIDYIQEFAGTPRVVILFRIIRSIAAPRSYTYLHDVFQAKNLRKDFMQVVDSFK